MADKLLKSIKFPTLPDRYVIGDSTLTEEGAAADAKAVGDALATKADTNGLYEDLIVGGAEQLMSDEYETDKEPYLFRTTGGSADVGNREYLDKIVGGTVAWNQLVSDSYSSETSLIPFQVGVRIVAGHKYLIHGSRSDNSKLSFAYPYVRYNGASVSIYNFNIAANGALEKYAIFNSSYTGEANGTASADEGNIWIYQGITNENYVGFSSLNIIDLTQMFGSTIADYIYSLETANAGAGVAWFKKLFPKDYYPYDLGTLRSVEGVSAHETVGFNQWDEEWENGYYNTTTGAKEVSADNIRSKNEIPVIGSTTYYITMPNTASVAMNVQYRKSDGTFIQNEYANTSGNHLFTTPSDCRRVTLYMTGAYGTTYNHDICINLSDPTRNGQYEPYTKHTYPLDSSLTLRGVPKLVDGKLAFDGDVYLPSGEVQRRYGVVDLGTLNWKIVSGTVGGSTTGEFGYFESLAQITNVKAPSLNNQKYSDGVCSNFLTGVTATSIFFGTDGGGHIAVAADNKLRVSRTDDTKDASQFKTAMSGVYLVYELATPTTETADGYEQYQRCDPSGTEEFVTTGIVPVGHETRYPHDLKKKIETAPDSPSTDGTYLMKRSGGKNTYMALPSTPSANGAYVLTVTVSGGSASYSWAAKE